MKKMIIAMMTLAFAGAAMADEHAAPAANNGAAPVAADTSAKPMKKKMKKTAKKAKAEKKEANT